MPKITFLGAGSTVFAKNLLGDCLCVPALRGAHFALYDIDGGRLRDSARMLGALNDNLNEGRATITAHLGVRQRRAALRGADFVINAIQVGGYKPATVTDFEIPKRHGLRQTIGDTLGIGGIFRALRTVPVLLEFARDMAAVCPGAWFLNYVNPMAMLTMALLEATPIRTVGLCHSVQACARELLTPLGLWARHQADLNWKIAGINHQAWLLEITAGGRDLYPEIRKRAAAMNAKARRPGGTKHGDMVRYEFMRHFGYYITESSEHSAEYMPYWIRAQAPGLIEELNIPLDEYPRRCEEQLRQWAQQRAELVTNRTLSHTRTEEFGSRIIEAMVTGVPCRVHGNVSNRGGLIPNLPARAVVEVACLVDRNGVQPTPAGELPEQLAAINRTNINVQLLTVEAALTRRREHVYHAAYLDPHTSAELTLDQTRRMCDDLMAAHGPLLPKFR